MKYQFILILTAAILLASCGKKDDTQTTSQQQSTTSGNQQQTQQQSNQTQQQTNQTKKDTSGTNPDVKKTDVKKTDDKKSDVDKKPDSDLKQGPIAIDNNQKIGNPDGSVTQNDIDFAPIYSKKCAKCHGKNGHGKPDGAPNLTADSVRSKSDSKLLKIISSGVKNPDPDGDDMPAWKGKLSDEEINAAIKYIKNIP
jgi:cytochrome c5